MSDNITVAIKVRPLIKREQDEGQRIPRVVGENSITQIDCDTNKLAESEFRFDYIFDMNKTNQDVFNGVAMPIVEAAMKGFNGKIFTYGQTGSGKTYTMTETKAERGVIAPVIDYIHNAVKAVDNSLNELKTAMGKAKKEHQNQIEAMKSDIERLELNLEQTNTELANLNIRFDELNHGRENVVELLEESKKKNAPLDVKKKKTTSILLKKSRTTPIGDFQANDLILVKHSRWPYWPGRFVKENRTTFQVQEMDHEGDWIDYDVPKRTVVKFDWGKLTASVSQKIRNDHLHQLKESIRFYCDEFELDNEFLDP